MKRLALFGLALFTTYVFAQNEGDEYYTAKNYKALCTNENGQSISIEGSKAEFLDETQSKTASFKNVNGVYDAFGIYHFSSRGMSLLLDKNRGSGQYLGATGVGAWQIQELRPISFNQCTLEEP